LVDRADLDAQLLPDIFTTFTSYKFKPVMEKSFWQLSIKNYTEKFQHFVLF